jgi:hypothetical protein
MTSARPRGAAEWTVGQGGRNEAMSTLYVARSANTSNWASDVGLSKHIFKVGIADEPVKELIAKGWAGETDWTLVKSQPIEGIGEEEAIARLARKEKLIDPKLYPHLKGATGVFKVLPAHVENQIIVQRAMANEAELRVVKLKPADFADYLIRNALK